MPKVENLFDYDLLDKLLPWNETVQQKCRKKTEKMLAYRKPVK